jgi:hypothetical protein
MMIDLSTSAVFYGPSDVVTRFRCYRAVQHLEDAAGLALTDSRPAFEVDWSMD